VIIALWDMNILSNPYFRRKEIESSSTLSDEQYIQKKREELLELTAALGIKNVKIYNSSEIWARLIQQKEQALFVKYYSTLSMMDIDEPNLNDKINYLVQLPADLFFVNYFHLLYPEDIKAPIDVIYANPARKTLYYATRKAMYHEGLISVETPILILSKEIPRIEIDTQIPHWDMTLGEINRIISKWRYDWEQLEELFSNVIALVLPEIKISASGNSKTVKTVDAVEELKKLDKNEVSLVVSRALFDYFQKAKELMHAKHEFAPDFLSIKTGKEVNNLGALLKSKNTMKIIALANGTRTTTEIAKASNMQLSNTSQYISKLEKAGIIKIKDKKVFRSVKGIKINFDASITTV
jgi:hypothetical protein